MSGLNFRRFVNKINAKKADSKDTIKFWKRASKHVSTLSFVDKNRAEKGVDK